ncbi:MAG TPA: dihydroorotase [Planctomycetes bacterium]|nr:dihydroorotase [Planctomycetaceae bacterium]HIN94921.1 dihydroorotase [Planctomycetota bacterium]
MSEILIRNGRLIDPSQGLDRVTNILVQDGRIADLDVKENGQATIIDATDRIVAPGLIDLHVQLREPGHEEDETIESGTAAALAGGFTAIAYVPDTEPPLDTQAGVEYVRQKASRADHCRVYVLACVSKNQEGNELAEIGTLVEAGAVGLSDATRPLHNAELLRRALEYCRMFKKPIFSHPEVLELTHDGIMHEGVTSMVLGLAGMPADAEDVMTGRDLRLAEATGGQLHLMNISSGGSVDLIRRAKARGVTVTAEVCPPHFSLTDECLRSFNSNFKINPPLRSQDHVEACIEGLVDGTIDVIASGHSPRASEKKMRELDQAPFGMVNLETTLALTITHLIAPGHLDWPTALEKLTINPARILDIDKGTLQVGADADITIINPDIRWQVCAEEFYSPSSNTPFEGLELQGRAEHVLVGGQIKYTAGKVL